MRFPFIWTCETMFFILVMLENGNSIIFESGNSESLLKAILKFESLTDLERNKLSSSAKKMSNKFSFEEIGRKHNEFFFGNE